MESQNNTITTDSPGWKWTALFHAAAATQASDGQWQAWLAAAQRAEEGSLLAFWARRRQPSA